MWSLLKKSSAWIPIAIPLAFVAYIIVAIFFLDVAREEDEGVGAHLFQIWLVLEPFMLGYFLMKWMQKFPREVLYILGLQIIAALLPLFAVHYFQL